MEVATTRHAFTNNLKDCSEAVTKNKKMRTNIKNNILSLFPLGRRKMGLLLLLLTTTIVFSQKEKPSDKKIDIKTMAKNHVRKGNDLYSQGQYANANKEYKKAMVLNPDYDKANYNFGNTQFLQNKMKEAKEQYELVSKTTKDKFIRADASHNLGNIAMQEKKYAEAVNAYKESMRNNPNDDETRYNLALAQKLLKEQQKKDDKKKDDKKKDNKDKKDKKKDDKKKEDDKKDQDKKDDKKKDQDEDKKDKKDEKKDEKKDDKGDKKDKKDKEEQQKPKPKQSKLSPEQVKQLLEAMNKEEKKTQKKMDAKKARGKKVKQEKDW